MKSSRSWLRDYAEIFVICAMIFVFTRGFVFQQSKIPSGSMEETLLIGDYIMVNRFVYAPTSFAWERNLLPIQQIKRGDVIVFKHPVTPELQYIKRVAGVPGDWVEIRKGWLFVNGARVEEPYVPDHFRDPRAWMAAQRVLEDHYFVLGDHRNNSLDSEEWGQVPVETIKGRALMIWWSFSEAGDTVHMTPAERLRSWIVKVFYFFPRTRWERCFSWIR